MGIGDFVSFVALIISILSIWLGWRSQVKNDKLLDEIRESHRREARRVDYFIERLMAQRGDSP